MNILLLGNGFDLAHLLPTTYNVFIEFAYMTIRCSEDGFHISEVSKENTVCRKAIADGCINAELMDLVNKNFWVNYLYNRYGNLKENWTGFESDISEFVKCIDERIDVTKKKEFIDNTIKSSMSQYLQTTYFYELSETIKNSKDWYSDFKTIIINDLRKLIRAFEIYINDYVNTNEISCYSPDIKEFEPDKIICFNYTNTYQRVYQNENSIDFDYIHGEAKIMGTLESNNMVMGIDEYLNEEKDTALDFISFKKYYQRIYNGTGSEYKHWVSDIQREYNEYVNQYEEDTKNKVVYSKDIVEKRRSSELKFMEAQGYKGHKLVIFGHSLDVTDKDILKDLIINDNVDTTIYYYNKGVFAKQIANLVKIIGQEELIRRTGGPNKTITFKQQRPMEQTNFKVQ